MKKTNISILLLVIILATLTSVSGIDESNTCEEVWEYLTVDLAIEQGDTLPDYLPYKNERTNFHTTEGEFIGYIVTEEGVISDIGNDKALEEPTFTLEIDSVETVKEVIESEAPLKKFNEKIKSEELGLKGETASKEVKGWFMKIIAKIISWFQ